MNKKLDYKSLCKTYEDIIDQKNDTLEIRGIELHEALEEISVWRSNFYYTFVLAIILLGTLIFKTF